MRGSASGGGEQDGPPPSGDGRALYGSDDRGRWPPSCRHSPIEGVGDIGRPVCSRPGSPQRISITRRSSSPSPAAPHWQSAQVHDSQEHLGFSQVIVELTEGSSFQSGRANCGGSLDSSVDSEHQDEHVSHGEAHGDVTGHFQPGGRATVFHHLRRPRNCCGIRRPFRLPPICSLAATLKSQLAGGELCDWRRAARWPRRREQR